MVIVYFPAYLHHLPESNNLIIGEYGFIDGKFWPVIHPFVLLSTILVLVLNWKVLLVRKLTLIAFGIYILALVVTFVYFFPELSAFAESSTSEIPALEWIQRGNLWEKLSWVRGGAIFIGFILMVIALANSKMAMGQTS